MSKYRQVQVGFWQDGFVLDLTPEEKYFYIYLMTNSKASQIGIYELPKRIIETETGYNRETVEKLLQRFADYGKIAYNEATKEIMLINWVRHNWNNSPKVVSRVEEELRSVKHVPYALNYLEIANSIKADTVSIQYPYSIDSLCKQEIRDKEKEKDKEKDKEQQPTEEKPKEKPVVAADAPGMAFRFYEQNISMLSPYISENIGKMIDETSEEMVCEAFKRAVEADGVTNKLRYADSIIRTWTKMNIKTLADVAAADKEFERRKQQPSGKPLEQQKQDSDYNYGF